MHVARNMHAIAKFHMRGESVGTVVVGGRDGSPGPHGATVGASKAGMDGNANNDAAASHRH